MIRNFLLHFSNAHLVLFLISSSQVSANGNYHLPVPETEGETIAENTEFDPNTVAAAEGRSLAPGCWRAGDIYYPDGSTTCICTGFFSATCKKNGDWSTTTTPRSSSPSVIHPLDPLSSDEITRSKNIILGSSPGKSAVFMFNTISLKEPPKADLLPYFLMNMNPPRSSFVRRSISILWDTSNGRVYEVIVNLDINALESFMAMPEHIRTPLLTPDDDRIGDNAVRSDPRVQERCRQLGILDMSLVYTAVWPVGYIEDRPEYAALKRPYEVFFYVRNFKVDNPYAHPLPFVVIVDIVGPKVVAIENLPTHEGYDMGQNQNGNSVPRNPSNYDYKLRPANFLRKTDKPITVTSPQGPSYKVTGNLVEWQKFKLRIGFNAREGVILHNVVYEDNGQIRPILYRASMTEMGVIYGDPRPPYHRKYGFDEGNIGLGFCTNELKSPEDCVGATVFINGTLNNNNGDPVVHQNAICITEEDAGMLWKHEDRRTGRASSVRSHRLTIRSIATTGNYDLGINWMFYQDAAIQFNLQLTGLLSTNMLAVDGTPGGFGSIVFPQVNAQYHQHLVGLRLDTEIDGNHNSVDTVDVVPLDAPTGTPPNIYGQGFTIRNTPLRTQVEACTMTNPSSGRVWVVSNPSNIHPYTHTPVGWRFIPSNEAVLMMRRDSPILNPQLEYLTCDVWVTKYEEDQIFAGGFYFNNSGLPEWVRRDPHSSTVNTDVVLWHMFNVAHIPRAEDFPVMPVVQRSIWFEPLNFFLENPSLDVPPPSARSQRNEL